MSFESGTITFRPFYLEATFDAVAASDFRIRALPDTSAAAKSADSVSGWTTGAHMLDRNITEDTMRRAGYPRLNLVKAERRIPGELLNAEIKQEEKARMRAEGKDFLKRSEKSEIRKEVRDRMLPQMPFSLTGIPLVYHEESRMLYAGCSSDSKTDALMLGLKATLDVTPLPLDARFCALRRQKFDISKIDPISFSPVMENELCDGDIGRDFLTWLWFHSEARGGSFTIEGQVACVAISGPLTFGLVGNGAHQIDLRNGTPEQSTEAKAALLGGKKLARARLSLWLDKEGWECAFDADRFLFRGLKLPRPEEVLDQVSFFQDRMLSIDRFMYAFLQFFDRFMAERTGTWPKDEIFDWVRNHAAKT